jgi:hypothetical protein
MGYTNMEEFAARVRADAEEEAVLASSCSVEVVAGSKTDIDPDWLQALDLLQEVWEKIGFLACDDLTKDIPRQHQRNMEKLVDKIEAFISDFEGYGPEALGVGTEN